MNLRRPLSVVLAAAILSGAPGFPAWEAAAQVVRGPVSGPSFGAWAPVVGGLATALQTQPALASGNPDLATVFGRLRLELALQPRSKEALAFVSRLPAGVKAEAFVELPAEEQVRLAGEAVAALVAELKPRAEALVVKAAMGTLSPEETAELQTLSKSWFYLPSGTGQALRAAAAKLRGEQTLGLGARIARLLSGERKESPDAVVGQELKQVLDGAAALAEDAKEAGRADAWVPNMLAPYVAKALDEAEVRAVERGVEAGKVAQAVIENHTMLFGKVADRGLFKTLRSRGEWTEFVAAASLHAAARVAELGKAGVNALAKAAEGDDLRLAIPAWHPLFGRYSSIAEWLTEAHGKPDDSGSLKGLKLFNAFGIPVRAQKSLFIALALGAFQFLGVFAKASPDLGPVAHMLQGFGAGVLLYAGVLLHEFGHAFAARAFGIRTRQIILNWMGGGAEVVRGFRKALPEFVIALAGPVVSAVIGVASIALGRELGGAFLAPLLILTGKLNVFLAVMNMLPMFPMDGGRVLRAILTKPFGSYWGTKAAGVVGMLVAWFIAYRGLTAFLVSGATGGLFVALIAMFFAAASSAMSVHPGTTLVDEKGKKS